MRPEQPIRHRQSCALPSWQTCPQQARHCAPRSGHGKVDKQRLPLTDNSLIEAQLGEHGIICMEDLIHEIYTVGPHFKEASNFLWPMKLSSPSGGFGNKLKHFNEGGQAGLRGEKINGLIKQMI